VKVVAQAALTRTPPAPRSLSTVRGARNELCRLYRELRRGECTPEIAGRGAHILGLIIRTGTDFELEQRLAAVQERMAAVEEHVGAAKLNGGGRPEVRL
jgi:hypothetical protein